MMRKTLARLGETAMLTQTVTQAQRMVLCGLPALRFAVKPKLGHGSSYQARRCT